LCFIGGVRKAAGLPESWLKVESWLDTSKPVTIPTPPAQHEWKRKCPEVPFLPSYEYPPHDSFWASFPFNPLPITPATTMRPAVLASLLSDLDPYLTETQRLRGQRVLEELTFGVRIPFKRLLPSIQLANTESTFIHGEEFTDTLASWICKGFVSGPFCTPPVPQFRANQMMAIEQKEKIRIIMNLSAPDGESYNDAIDEHGLDKITMSTARHVGYTIMDCGVGACLWKWDLVDAYKTLPAAQSDLGAQGFSWLGMFFTENQEPFGSEAAPAAFDRVGHTLADLAIITSNIPSKFVHRCLDDLPLVTPAKSTLGPVFADHYNRICAAVGVKLAPPCPRKEKAFENSTSGVVLGIRFDTVSLTWYISHQKRDRLLEAISGPLLGDLVSLEAMQRLLGLLNDLGQMVPFMRAFRQPLVNFLAQLSVEGANARSLPHPARMDLKVWANVAVEAANGLPIPVQANPALASSSKFRI